MSGSHSNHAPCNFKNEEIAQVAMFALLIRLDVVAGSVNHFKILHAGRRSWNLEESRLGREIRTV